MRRERHTPAAELRSQWQIRQGALCGCRGHDEYCPCQNTDRSARPGHAETCKHADTATDPISSMLREAYQRLENGDLAGAGISLHGARLAHSFATLTASPPPPETPDGDVEGEG